MLQASESYLYPRFDALENGATPNFAEIHAYLRDGIELDFVEDFRRHVPCRLSPLAPLPPPTHSAAAPPPALATSPSASLVKLMNRVPLLPLRSSPPLSPSPSPPPDFPPSPEAAEPEVVSPVRATTPPDSIRAERLPAPVKPHPNPSLSPAARTMLAVPPPPAALVRAMPLYNVFPPPQLFHPVPPFAPVPHVYASPLPSMPFPYPPHPCHSPPPPYSGAPTRPPEPPAARRCSASSGMVVLSASECEIYSLLNRVDRNAAYYYMMETINRQRASSQVSTLNPEATEFRSASVTTPPGFELP